VQEFLLRNSEYIVAKITTDQRRMVSTLRDRNACTHAFAIALGELSTHRPSLHKLYLPYSYHETVHIDYDMMQVTTHLTRATDMICADNNQHIAHHSGRALQ